MPADEEAVLPAFVLGVTLREEGSESSGPILIRHIKKRLAAQPGKEV